MALQTEQDGGGEGTYTSGDPVGGSPAPGSLSCVDCGFAIPLAAVDAVPNCPSCGSSSFRRARLFDRPTMDADAVEAPQGEPTWLDEAREKVEQAGPHLAWRDGGEVHTLRLEAGWVRIGRSTAAELRLDDATVSRRHALVVLTDEGELRALDDRSMNGLFVNGNRVEWAPLSDGDELEIGRYRVYLLN